MTQDQLDGMVQNVVKLTLKTKDWIVYLIFTLLFANQENGMKEQITLIKMAKKTY